MSLFMNLRIPQIKTKKNRVKIRGMRDSEESKKEMMKRRDAKIKEITRAMFWRSFIRI